MKAARPHLKQLQQQVKLLSAENDSTLNSQSGQAPLSPDSFQWITKEQTFVMVYLVRIYTAFRLQHLVSLGRIQLFQAKVCTLNHDLCV